jgi:hypothetical protein
MEWSSEMALNLVSLNQYNDLAHKIREKLYVTPEEIERSYANLRLWVPKPENDETNDVIHLHRHRRFLENHYKTAKRTARSTIFAASLSSVERFLILRMGYSAHTKYGKIIDGLKTRIESSAGEQKKDDLTQKLCKLDKYRIARNKILHQSDLINPSELKKCEKKFYTDPIQPYWFEKVANSSDLFELIIGEDGLSDFISFLIILSDEIDQMLRDQKC